MGLALLTLGLLTPVQAQTIEWVRTRCNADGSPYLSRIVQNNYNDNTLHGPVTGACTDTYTPLMHSGTIQRLAAEPVPRELPLPRGYLHDAAVVH